VSILKIAESACPMLVWFLLNNRLYQENDCKKYSTRIFDLLFLAGVIHDLGFYQGELIFMVIWIGIGENISL
ncbi:MAG: hypothetical protein SVT56_14030, partial [Chloroflexota bacterium]|nr:hypothetical protein [Chloroflexota bacterium]